MTRFTSLAMTTMHSKLVCNECCYPVNPIDIKYHVYNGFIEIVLIRVNIVGIMELKIAVIGVA